jgi:hypothetical protein
MVALCAVNQLAGMKGYNGTGTPGDGINTYNQVGIGFEASGASLFTLNAAPVNGATTATLTAPWGGSTGTNWIVFNDGEYRSVTMTNGNATTSAFAALTGPTPGFTTFCLINPNPNIAVLYQAVSIVGGTIQPGFSSGANCQGVYAAEYNSISAAVAFNWFVQSAPGTGSNAVASQTSTITLGNTAFMVWGYVQDHSNAGVAQTAGTSPLVFTRRDAGISTDAGFVFITSEDTLLVSSGTYGSTFTTSRGSDVYLTLMAAFPASPPVPLLGQIIM